MDCKYWLKFCQLLFLVAMCHSEPILDKAITIDKEVIKKNIHNINNNVASLIHRFFGPEKVVIHIPVDVLKTLNGTTKYESTGGSFPYKFVKDEVVLAPEPEVEYHGLNKGEKQIKNSAYDYKPVAPAIASPAVQYEVEHGSAKSKDEGKYFTLENGVLKEVTPDEVARHYHSTAAYEATQVKRDHGEVEALALTQAHTTPTPAVYTIHKTLPNVKPIPVYKLLGYKLADSNIGALEVVEVNHLYKPKKSAAVVDLSSLKLKNADGPTQTKAQPLVLVQAPNLNSYGQKTNIQWKLPKATSAPLVSPVKINYAPIQTIIHNHDGYQSVAKQSAIAPTGHGGGGKPAVHFHYETSNSPQHGGNGGGGSQRVVFSSPSAGGGSYYAAPKPVPQYAQPTAPAYEYSHYGLHQQQPSTQGGAAQYGYAKSSNVPEQSHNSGYGTPENYSQDKTIYSQSQGLPAPQHEVPHPASGGFISNGYYVRPPVPTAPVFEQQQEQHVNPPNQPNYGYPALPTADPSFVYQAVAQQNQHQYTHQEQPNYSVQSQEKWSQPIHTTAETYYSIGSSEGETGQHEGSYTFQPSAGEVPGEQDKVLVIIAGKNGQPQLAHQEQYENSEDEDDNGETNYGYFLQDDTGHSESRLVTKKAANNSRNDWRAMRRNLTRSNHTKNSRFEDRKDSNVDSTDSVDKVKTLPNEAERQKTETKRESSAADNNSNFVPSSEWNFPFKDYEGAKIYDLNTFSAVQEYLNQKNATTTMSAPTTPLNGLPSNHRTNKILLDASTRDKASNSTGPR